MQYGPWHKKTSSGFANNKGADQAAHRRSLVSTFIIRLLESIYLNLPQEKFHILSYM